MTRRRSRIVAWVSLLAMLFSSVSPGVAATLLSDRPAALAQMLGLPAAAQPTAHHEHAAQASHRDGGAADDRPSPAPHTSHGIYCSLCLNASSTLAVAATPAPLLIATAATENIRTHEQQSYTATFHPVFRSRAPPR